MLKDKHRKVPFCGADKVGTTIDGPIKYVFHLHCDEAFRKLLLAGYQEYV